MKRLASLAMAALALTACSSDNSELPSTGSTPNAPLYVTLVARIQGVTESVDTRATDTFQQNDQLALVMDGKEVSCWTYSNGWTTSPSLYWPDSEQKHTFCAYFPYIEPEEEGKVNLPDLSNQSGSEEDLRKYDFVAAKMETTYSVTSGVVKFTGDNALQHKLSLVKLTLTNEKDLANATVTKIVWKATGLTTRATYSYVTNEITYSETSTAQDVLTSEPEDLKITADQTLSYICNPLASAADISLEIHYTSENEKARVASTTFSSKTLGEGQQQECTVSVVDDRITIEEVTVSDWTAGTDLGTVTISGKDETTAEE